MQNQYAYPPPGLIYSSNLSPGPPFVVPSAPAQYSPLPSPAGSANGHQHAYPYPQHHHNPQMAPYTRPGQVYLPYPSQKPPLNYQRDHNGWFVAHPHPYPQTPPTSAPIQTSAPQHPPGLAIPQIQAPETVEEPPALPIPSENVHIHDFWKGRLAPLPGYRSRPILVPRREPPSIEKEPPKKVESPSDSTSPRSLSANSHEWKLGPAPIKSPKTPKTEEKIENQKKDFVFDTYADSFIPQYLFNIQKQVHPLKPLPPVPVFPPMKYLQSFLIPRLIDESNRSDKLALLHAPPLSKEDKPSPLAADTYHSHWLEILRWELDAVALEKEQIVLWKVVPKVAVWKESEFVLFVPGIRENHPHLEVGDLVHLREVMEAEKRGTNRALEGRVVALRKREGLVHISSLPLKEHSQAFVPLTLETTKTENGYVVFGPEDLLPFTFNVSFMTNARPLCTMESAVSAVSNILNSKEVGTNLARQWLFPEPEHYLNSPCVMLGKGDASELQWMDPGLNEEQRLAVSSVALYQSPIPHLISGPPGTGKTRTVVETVLQIFKAQPEACILLCAPSNPATDTLVLRLQKNLLQHEMLRLNDPNRTFAEVPDIIKPFCYVENDKFALPPWKKLMQYRVVVCCCLDAGILAAAQCTNVKLMSMEEDITSSLHPYRREKHVVQPHWTHLIIDEAAQGSEPEILIPISVVLPNVYVNDNSKRAFMPQLALCGDINQLGPTIASEEARSAEFEVSLLERLFERAPYSRFEEVRAHQGVSKRLPPFTTLVKNYRSHPVILMPPSAIFYNDTLQPFASNGRLFWSGLPNPNLPLKFIGTESVEKSNDEKASWYNPGQINIVVDTVKSLLDDPRKSDPPLRPADISVMAPWRKQVWTLRKRLRNEGLSAVDVGTVEDYQGRESRVVIISCVRSNPRFLEEDHKKGMGLLFERKRMNVAITRAKELLIVIGNGAILQRDPYWKSFLQFTIRNGLYEGPELSLEMDGNYISRLESRLIQSAMNGSEVDPEEEGLLLAGGVAREVLRE